MRNSIVAALLIIRLVLVIIGIGCALLGWIGMALAIGVADKPEAAHVLQISVYLLCGAPAALIGDALLSVLE